MSVKRLKETGDRIEAGAKLSILRQKWLRRLELGIIESNFSKYFL
jgi:hypothetical protein